MTARELEFYRIASHTANAHQVPGFSRNRGDTRIVLTRTQNLLDAVQLAAEAEIARDGDDPNLTGHPLMHLISAPPPPLFTKLKAAIADAAAANAFAPPPPTPTPTRAFAAGDRVILARRPDENVGLPTEIRVGDAGTLRRPYDDDDGHGWEVEFDGHGVWWTPTNTLERI